MKKVITYSVIASISWGVHGMAKQHKDPLAPYRNRRVLSASNEPGGGSETLHKHPIFVIQEHAARHLHYDVRLEIGRVLASWAVPKGPSTNPHEKRLAVITEDHPLEYARFEGVIPEGNYGAGTVMVWDIGTYKNIKKKDGALISMQECLKQGTIEVFLEGTKLHGAYALIRMQGRDNQWLLIKMNDEFVNKPRNPVATKTKSALTNRTMKQIEKEERDSQEDDPITFGRYRVDITHPERVLFSADGITKKEMIDYYTTHADYILPYMHNRLLTMLRFPEGIEHEGFYQKNAADYFPAWIKTVPIKKEGGGTVNYVVCNNIATLAYLANQACITPHLWLSKIDKLRYPDRMIFDLDPSGTDFNQIRFAALRLRDILEHELGLTSFVMTTGSRGLHIWVPLKRRYDFEYVHKFARDVAHVMVMRDPAHITLELTKKKREDKIFVDFLRNSYSATAVAPYSIRALPDAPVATPLAWKEVKDTTLHPQKYTMRTIKKRLARIKDPWQDMEHVACSLTKARKQLDRMLNND
jgi:bifunctional non-homologous end joining protein LigD